MDGFLVTHLVDREQPNFTCFFPLKLPPNWNDSFCKLIEEVGIPSPSSHRTLSSYHAKSAAGEHWFASSRKMHTCHLSDGIAQEGLLRDSQVMHMLFAPIITAARRREPFKHLRTDFHYSRILGISRSYYFSKHAVL